MIKKRIFVVIAIVAISAPFIYIYRDRLFLASAIMQNQSRPEFMDDIRWKDEHSDLAIKKQFPVGSAEEDLINALRAAKFNVSPVERNAELRLNNIPCAELLEVNWAVNAQGKLLEVEGAASEAGCL
jgi:hypothetical protein